MSPGFFNCCVKQQFKTHVVGSSFISYLSFVISAAAKKASCSHPEASGDKGEDGEGQKEGVNGEAEEASNGKVKEGEGAACGSKLRACRRTGGGEGSGAGMELGVRSLNKMT